MREAGAALLFGARADIVNHVDGDYGDGVVLGEDDAQAVLQLIGFDRNAEFGGDGKGGAGERQTAGEDQLFHTVVLGDAGIKRVASGSSGPRLVSFDYCRSRGRRLVWYAPRSLNMKTRIAAALFLFLLINSGYIAAYPAPSLFYMGNVVAHLAVGLLLMAAALWAMKRYPRESGAFLAAGLVALFLVARGNTLDHRSILWLHIWLASGRGGVGCVTLPPPASVRGTCRCDRRTAAGIGGGMEPGSSRPEQPDCEPAIRPALNG